MSITSDLLRVSVRGRLLGQRVQVVQSFGCGGAGLLTANCAGVAEAFWNAIKTNWRGVHVASADDLTQSVFVEEIGGSLGFGEYAVPSGEQQGTRTPVDTGSFMPPYVGVGVRLTVATRVTRPGQKRFWGALEGDNENGLLGAALFAATETLMDQWIASVPLGTPADVVALLAHVVHYDHVTGAPGARQPVAGYLVNPNLTTQNSRKVGRGE